MKNLHAGKRAFILGNGPGLDLYNLKKLENEITFGANLIYRRFVPDYYVVCNPTVLDQFRDYIVDQFEPKRRKFIDLEYDFGPLFFNTDPDGPFHQGWTVTFVSLQLAFIMGFETIYLIGVNHDYGTIDGNPNEKKVYDREPGRHARGLGYGGGDWDLPDLDRSYLAYKLAAEIYKNDGRSIFIVPPTTLDLFPKVTYDEII